MNPFESSSWLRRRVLPLAILTMNGCVGVLACFQALPAAGYLRNARHAGDALRQGGQRVS